MNVRVVAEAKDGAVRHRIVRDAAGDYYLDYEENGRVAEQLMKSLDHALREFNTAIRDMETWSIVAEVREFEREQARLMREEV